MQPVRNPKTSPELRIVTLESPYDTLGDPVAGNLFLDTLRLRIKGYLAEYPYGVLPLDTSDFIATHHLVCRQAGDELVPLMGYKSVAYSKCEKHHQCFPILSYVESANGHRHSRAIREIVAKCESVGREISFDSTWTIAPEARENRELRDELREIMKAIHVLYHHDHGIHEIVAGGVVRFKMEKLYYFWGYEDLSDESGTLPRLVLPHLSNEEIMMFHLKEFSDEAIRHAEAYRTQWDARVLLQADGTRDRRGAAAKAA